MSLKAINHDLTNKQKEVIDYKGEELLVKGIAGSGKTTVLLRKARKMIEEDPSIKIGFFTYNKTLSKYAAEIASKIGSDNLKVYTFHGWGYNVLKNIQGGKLSVLPPSEKKSILVKAIDKVKGEFNHRFVEDEDYKVFLEEEISWIKGRGIKSLAEYKSVLRAGRGSSVRVTKSDREIIWKVFESYEVLRIDSKKIDYDDFANIILNKKNDISDKYRFDQVMVDEGQDLQLVQLQLLRSIADKGFAVAADKGQKIYKTSFTWKDVGINILGGRTKILQNTFRSTREIIQMAHSLQLNDSIIKDEEYIEPIFPEYTGPRPTVYECESKQEQDIAIVSTIQKLIEDDPDKTIGIISKEWRSVNRLYHKFQAQGIPHEFIKKDKGSSHTPGVKLTSFHSAKGLEFDYVIIPDLVDNDSLDENLRDEEYWEVERRLLYGTKRLSEIA